MLRLPGGNVTPIRPHAAASHSQRIQWIYVVHIGFSGRVSLHSQKCTLIVKLFYTLDLEQHPPAHVEWKPHCQDSYFVLSCYINESISLELFSVNVRS